MDSVWIYLNDHGKARKFIGDEDWVKIFSTRQAAYDWLADHDPEGVAWEYRIETDIPRRAPTRAKTGMAHLDRADSDLFGSRYGR